MRVGAGVALAISKTSEAKGENPLLVFFFDAEEGRPEEGSHRVGVWGEKGGADMNAAPEQWRESCQQIE